ncbi:Sec1-binding region of Mso1-domain-containing protein [Tuber borchii]|uniref:Sec1-binding region of Mso1-domain-containing protein n=1 Tax=Tuber borchii TaxID=42251 RepID=A0A2T6ZBU6_TUBBO|nr:Sec1-binding region of Mso1-domain-containing protein [Tuber borchii]
MAYFSSILTATKSRYQTLRGIDEQDGDSEDDSHISRVLRSYYQEQGRPLPDWLGGGPPPPQNLRNNYGQQRPGMAGRGQQGGGPQNANATLSDIWDTPPPQGNQRPAFGVRHQPAQQQGLFPGDDDRSQQGGGGGNAGGAAGVAMTAQQRIKERLWGGRTASPPPNTSKPSPPPPSSVQMPLPPSMQQPRNNGGGYRPPQGPPPGQQRGGGGRSYGQSGMPWDDGYSGGGGGYSDGYDGNNFSPGFTPAGSPGSGSQGSNSNLRRGKLGLGMGLPTGPGMMRQQGGNHGGY